MKKVEWLTFEEARAFARQLNLNSYKEWKDYAKSGQLPENIPSYPQQVYKNKGWISWGDFLNTSNVHTKQFLTFEEARTFVHDLNLGGADRWYEYIKSGNKPDDIPSDPQGVYGRIRGEEAID